MEYRCVKAALALDEMSAAEKPEAMGKADFIPNFQWKHFL